MHKLLVHSALWQAEPSYCASLLGFSIHAPYDTHPFHDPAWMVISGHCGRIGLAPTAPGTGKAYIRGAGYDNQSLDNQVELLLVMGPARLAPGQPYDWTFVTSSAEKKKKETIKKNQPHLPSRFGGKEAEAAPIHRVLVSPAVRLDGAGQAHGMQTHSF